MALFFVKNQSVTWDFLASKVRKKKFRETLD